MIGILRTGCWNEVVEVSAYPGALSYTKSLCHIESFSMSLSSWCGDDEGVKVDVGQGKRHMDGIYNLAVCFSRKRKSILQTR